VEWDCGKMWLGGGINRGRGRGGGEKIERFRNGARAPWPALGGVRTPVGHGGEGKKEEVAQAATRVSWGVGRRGGSGKSRKQKRRASVVGGVKAGRRPEWTAARRGGARFGSAASGSYAGVDRRFCLVRGQFAPDA
jgi:hypothetical protein